MNMMKDIVVPLLIVFAASAVVVLVMMPLENTAWAEGMRTPFVEEGETAVSTEGATAEDSEELPAAFAFIASFIKITLFMGIPGLITLGILRLTNRKSKRASTA